MEYAKYLVAIVAIFNFGGFLADAVIPATSKQHLWNPNWPRHAKFHNAQTMLMGFFGGFLSLFLLFGSGALTLRTFLVAAVAGGSYFAAMACATIFPGTAWTDPEFVSETPHPLGLAPQQLVTYVLCTILIVAVAIALLAH